MADDRQPLVAFNFAVEIHVPGLTTRACSAAFSECDGLEASIEVKTIREGGNNARQIRLAGAVNVNLLTLRRGMTTSFDLWDWLSLVQQHPSLRADAEVVLLAADGVTERARFVLSRCLPAKLKAPALNAKDGVVAVEELQLAFEAIALKRPGEEA